MFWSDYEDDNTLTPADGVEYHKAQLAKAVSQNNIPQLTHLLEVGGGIELVDSQDNTLLHDAVACDKSEVLEFLLSVEGAPLDAEEGMCQRTALIAAVADGKEDLAWQLVKKGADINLVDLAHISALYYAVEHKFPELSSFLIEAGADINVRNDYGATCLSAACASHWPEGVCMLLYYGADVSIPTKTGYSPFHIADEEIKEILFDYVFDGVRVPILLCTWTILMRQDSPLLPRLFDNISELLYDSNELYLLSYDLPILNSHFLQLTIDNFDYAIKDLIGKCSIFEIFAQRMLPRAVQNLEIILNSHLGSHLVKTANKQVVTNTSNEFSFLLGDFVKDLKRLSTSGQQHLLLLVSRMLKKGLVVMDYDLSSVYLNYGFCPLFKEMILADVDKHVWKPKDLMPLLIHDLTMTIDDFLVEPEGYNLESLDLVLEQFSYWKLNEFCLNLGRFEERVKKLPQVPLLIELARNVARKYIAEYYKIQKFGHFRYVLERLPISEHHQKILTYEKKLYV